MTNDQIRVSMLLETRSLRPHVRIALAKMLSHRNVSVDYLFINESKSIDDEVTEKMSLGIGYEDIKLLLNYLRNRRFSLLWKAEVKLAGILGDEYVQKYSRSWGRKSIMDLPGMEDAQQIEYKPIPAKNDIGFEVPDSIIEMASESDLIINWDRTIWRGDILDATEYGLWSFHAGDIRKYRGRPAGFFQFLNDEETIGVTLQQLTPELDGGKIIETGTTDVSECTTFTQYKVRQDQLFEPLLKEGIEQIQREEFDPYKPEDLGKLTKEEDGDKFIYSIQALVKNLRGRYLSNI